MAANTSAAHEDAFLALEAGREKIEEDHPNLNAARSSQWQKARSPTKAPSRPTAYLDGMRGWAAMSVYALHHQGFAHSGSDSFAFEDGFGTNHQYYLIRFPFFRLFFSGAHFAVAILFIISGYVLACGPLKIIHERDSARLADSLGSAVFRRWLRLFLPVIATSFVWMTVWHMLPNGSSAPVAPPRESSYHAEVWRWWCNVKNYAFVFTPEPKDSYNFYMWTIPFEFRGSMVVYAALLALGRATTPMRLICEAALVYCFTYIMDGWYCGMFAIGMLMCDIDMLSAKGQLPEVLKRFVIRRTWPYYILLIIGLYLGGVPSMSADIEHLRRIPGWYYLSFLNPQAFFDFRWFFRFVAAVLTLIAVPHVSWLKAFMELYPSQYLGRVSYSLYLVHGPILWIVGDRIYAAAGRVTDGQLASVPHWINALSFPDWGPVGMELNYIIPHLILLPLTLFVAEIVTKTIDEPSVKIAKWLFDTTTTASSIMPASKKSSSNLKE